MEFDDVSRWGMVLFDGMRDVRAGLARFPAAGPRLVLANRRQHRRHAIHSWGVATMVVVIVLLDQFVWRPVIAWAEKFKVEQVESAHAPRSWVLDLLQHSRSLCTTGQKDTWPAARKS